MTLTFDEENLNELEKRFGKGENGAEEIAKETTKKMRERFRKHKKKSLRHWIVTEMGHKGTKRIHLHGIIFVEKEEGRAIRETGCYNRNWQRKANEVKGSLRYYWKYGDVWIGDYCNIQTASYITKYMLKPDRERPGFMPRLLVSPGIGAAYVEKNREYHKFRGQETITEMRLTDGKKVGLPKYYRSKLWTDEEREKLRIIRLDKNVGYINRIRYSNWNSAEIQAQLKQFRELQKQELGAKGFESPRLRRQKRIDNLIQKNYEYTRREGWMYTRNWKKRLALRKRRDADESILCLSGTRYAGIGNIPAFQGVNTILPHGAIGLRHEEHDERAWTTFWNNTQLGQSVHNRGGEDRTLRYKQMTTQWREKTPF